MDVVTFNGSEWRAKVDDPGMLPGDGWVIGAKGSKGRPGERGPAGPKGEPGEAAASIVEAVVADFEIIFLKSDGSTMSCNLLPLLEKMREAV
jgi:hypothetical protein